jgi:hypothetical protein
MRTGQVIGATNRYAEEAVSRPITVPEVYATLFHNLGIDPRSTIPDLNGRPQYIADSQQPVRELI